MHLSLDIQLTQALWAAVSSGTQESDLAPTVTSPGLRFGSGLAGHIVGFHVALSEGLPGVAISQSCSHHVSVVPTLPPASFFSFSLCFIIVVSFAIVMVTS